MKKTILLLILILNISCGSTNTKKPVHQLTFEERIDLLEYNLKLPLKWYPYLDIHEEITFSPLAPSNKDFSVSTSTIKIPPSEHNSISLKDFAKKNTKNLAKFVSVYSTNITLEQTKFGETCINNYSYRYSSKKIKTEKTYFKYKENYYCFIYSADDNLYDKYYNDSKKIFESLTFKE